jgi:hypothetical protein
MPIALHALCLEQLDRLRHVLHRDRATRLERDVPSRDAADRIGARDDLAGLCVRRGDFFP